MPNDSLYRSVLLSCTLAPSLLLAAHKYSSAVNTRFTKQYTNLSCKEMEAQVGIDPRKGRCEPSPVLSGTAPNLLADMGIVRRESPEVLRTSSAIDLLI